MTRALLVILFALAVTASTPALAKPIFGAVTAVSDSGEITLDTQEKFYLWGMVPADPKKFRDVLVGRRLYCSEVLGAMDCLMFARDEDQLVAPIHALAWLPDLGVARYFCTFALDFVIYETRDWGFAPGAFECVNGKPEFPPSAPGGVLSRSKEFGAILDKRRIILDKRRQLSSP